MDKKKTTKKALIKIAGKNLPDIITKSKVVSADKDWEFITKFTLIVNDILYGNQNLPNLVGMKRHLERMQ